MHVPCGHQDGPTLLVASRNQLAGVFVYGVVYAMSPISCREFLCSQRWVDLLDDPIPPLSHPPDSENTGRDQPIALWLVKRTPSERLNDVCHVQGQRAVHHGGRLE